MPSGFCGATAVLGIGLQFDSVSPEALRAALEIFPNRDDRCTAMPQIYILLTAAHDNCTPSRENRVCGRQLHIADDGIRVLADGESGHARCSFSIDVIGSDLFRETVRTAALFLATQQGRVPMHASAVIIGDCALVLAGRSGSGKSTLALAADRRGLPVLAEDTAFIQREPEFRVWGLADHIHVFEKDAPSGKETRLRLRSGRLKHALPVATARQSADKAMLCVLARGHRPILGPLSPDDAVRTLLRKLEPGYDLFADCMEDAIRAIASGGCWQLTLSHDPDAAIALLIDTFGARSG